MIRGALATLLLLAPLGAVAGTYAVAGSLDSGYGRTDISGAGVSARTPAWDFGGQLSFTAIPLRPDLLQAAGSVSYREFHLEAEEARNKTSALGYSGTLAVLQHLPVSLTVTAGRATTDFSSSAATTQTGSSLVNTQAATAVFRVDQAPNVVATFSRSDFENTSLGGEKTTGSSMAVSAGAVHQLENHGYSTNYNTSWNTGTFAESNYRTHNFTFFGNSIPSKGVELRVNEQYYLRTPTASSPNSPRLDDNNLSAVGTWRPGGPFSGNASYGYRHTVADFQGQASNRESLGHTMGVGGEWAKTPELSFSTGANVGFSEDRFGTETVRSSGEAVSGGARWMRTASGSTWTVSGSGSVGVSQSAGKDYGAFGFGGGAGWNGTAGTWTVGASYSGNFGSNLAGKLGWGVTNLVTGNADTAFLGGASLHGQVQLSDARQHNPLYGDSSAQTATLAVSAAYRVHSVGLQAGVSNAAAQGLSSPTGNQVLSTGTNTFSKFGVLNAGTALARDLSLSGFARYSSTAAPGRPDVWETAFNGSLGYRLGLFTLSLEDRYSIGGGGGVGTVKTNLILFRITRTFGVRI